MKRRIISLFSVFFAMSIVLSAVTPAFAQNYYMYDYYDYLNSEYYTAASIGDNYVKIKSYYSYPFELSMYDEATQAYVVIGYSKLDKNHNNIIKVGNLKAGTQYKLAARNVFEDNVYDEFNNVIPVTTFGDYSYFDIVTLPRKCELKSVKSTKGKLNVKWKGVKEADGYAVICSTSKSFKYPNCTIVNVAAGKTSVQISNLMNGKYYVAVKPYVIFNGVRYYAAKSNAINVQVNSGLSVKAEINKLKVSPTAAKMVKEITQKGVDINKYKTSYDKVKAVYNWHAKHFRDFADCVACNTSFNDCISLMFDDSRNPEFVLQLQAGEVRNNDGSQVIHKWSIWYISGKPYLFDPRLQGYTGNFTGDLYFAKPTTSSIFKRVYVPQYTYYEYNIGGKQLGKYNFFKNSRTDKIK